MTHPSKKEVAQNIFGFQRSKVGIRILLIAFLVEMVILAGVVDSAIDSFLALATWIFVACTAVVGFIFGYILNIFFRFKRRILCFSLGHIICLVLLVLMAIPGKKAGVEDNYRYEQEGGATATDQKNPRHKLINAVDSLLKTNGDSVGLDTAQMDDYVDSVFLHGPGEK